jgi:hypothetical protein
LDGVQTGKKHDDPLDYFEDYEEPQLVEEVELVIPMIPMRCGGTGALRGPDEDIQNIVDNVTI